MDAIQREQRNRDTLCGTVQKQAKSLRQATMTLMKSQRALLAALKEWQGLNNPSIHINC